MAYFGTSNGAVLCHRCCHTGTELSFDTLKLSECIQKKFCEVLQALDWAKRTEGSRDMHFCVKTVPIQYPLKKGLKNDFAKLRFLNNNILILIYCTDHKEEEKRDLGPIFANFSQMECGTCMLLLSPPF